MNKLILTGKDLGYYFLIIDMARIPEGAEQQLELEFDDEENDLPSEIEMQ